MFVFQKRFMNSTKLKLGFEILCFFPTQYCPLSYVQRIKSKNLCSNGVFWNSNLVSNFYFNLYEK